jgi:dihydropyrimidine dehydrogenase (NAD+) subunit PreA
MALLETTFLGIKFPNPFIVAASPLTVDSSKVIRAFEAGWGGAVLKTMGLTPTPHLSPRIHVIKSGTQKKGLLDIELFSDHELDYWLREIDQIRNSFPNRPLIASIAGGNNPRDWQDLVRRLESHHLSAYELNVSCPSFDKEKGEKLGQDPTSVYKVVSWVREVTRLPVIVKLTPNVTNIVTIAQAAHEAGADAFTTTNSLSALGGIDIHTFEPQPSVGGKSIYGGYGGPGLKPVSLKCTASVASALTKPVIGCGGISSWKDAVEYLAAGASLIQVCTAAMWHGFDLVKKLSQGLEGYLNSKGFTSPEEIVGKALFQIVSYSDLDHSIKLVAQINPEYCNSCGACVVSCSSGGYQAITLMDKGASIQKSQCGGCGLCVGICSQNAIEMVAT